MRRWSCTAGTSRPRTPVGRVVPRVCDGAHGCGSGALGRVVFTCFRSALGSLRPVAGGEFAQARGCAVALGAAQAVFGQQAAGHGRDQPVRRRCHARRCVRGAEGPSVLDGQPAGDGAHAHTDAPRWETVGEEPRSASARWQQLGLCGEAETGLVVSGDRHRKDDGVAVSTLVSQQAMRKGDDLSGESGDGRLRGVPFSDGSCSAGCRGQEAPVTVASPLAERSGRRRCDPGGHRRRPGSGGAREAASPLRLRDRSVRGTARRRPSAPPVAAPRAEGPTSARPRART